MKHILFTLICLASFNIGQAQNDTTNDSWESNAQNRVVTQEEAWINNHLTFQNTTGVRGIRRDNRAWSLDFTGGEDLNTGARIALSGDLRGGADNVNNGRMEFWTGGNSETEQAGLLGDYIFNTMWNGGEKTLMTLKSRNGRLGIGTTNPTAYVHVQGPPSGYAPGESGLHIEGNFNTYTATIRNTSGGNNAGGLLVETTDGNGLMNAFLVRTFIGNNPQTNFRIPNAGTGNKVLLVENGGSVGIGTTSPSYELDVCGFMRAEEIIVEEGWCDFVFDATYSLPTLPEQKAFIEQHGHLKNFPSEAEMNGQIQVGDISKRQQQTLEEMMLYLIKIEERVQLLEAENEELKTELETLKK